MERRFGIDFVMTDRMIDSEDGDGQRRGVMERKMRRRDPLAGSIDDECPAGQGGDAQYKHTVAV